jgi:peptide/nickel transport system permease protein
VARFIGRRLVETVPVLLLASLLVYGILDLVPGDPIDAMVGAAAGGVIGGVRPEIVQQLRLELGLDDPFPVRYVRWLAGAAHGDLGRSYVRKAPVAELIGQRLPSTLELAAGALLITGVLGVALGILAALRRNSWLDRLVMIVSLGGVSMPSFWFAMLLILAFSVGLGLFPATGSGGLDRLVLPAIALGYEGVALVARLTRASMLEALGRDWMTTARAKGLSRRVVVLRHGLRNALIPVVTILGLQLGRLLAGSVIIETVFARQGVGQLAIDAIQTKDFPVVQGVILLTAVSYVFANLLVDLTYGYIDPRIRTA